MCREHPRDSSAESRERGLVARELVFASASRGRTLVLQQKHELKVLEQRYCLGRRRFQDVVDRSYVLQGVGTGGHSSQALWPPLRGFL